LSFSESLISRKSPILTFQSVNIILYYSKKCYSKCADSLFRKHLFEIVWNQLF